MESPFATPVTQQVSANDKEISEFADYLVFIYKQKLQEADNELGVKSDLISRASKGKKIVLENTAL